MAKVQVFDPPMCCSTGVCGPEVDPAAAQGPRRSYQPLTGWLAASQRTGELHRLDVVSCEV